MLHSRDIRELFESVMMEDIVRYGIHEQDIRRAVQNMAHVYAPDPTSLKSDTVKVANYNDVAHRCAYLHKMAAFHTALVQNTMISILDQQWEFFESLTESGNFKICSLGGGPGSDVIGVLAALSSYFDAFQTDVKIIDIMEQWRLTFSSLIAHLAEGNYGTLRTCVADNFLEWNYIGANLLDRMSSSVNKAIAQASLVTMVKFISNAACQEAEEMIKKIFRCMKPGALILFIDNDGGGFHGLIRRAANEYRFNTAFGPLRHHTYENEDLKIERFGYTSCFSTTVTIHLLSKPLNQQDTIIPDNIPTSPRQQNSAISDGVVVCVQPPFHDNSRSFGNANVRTYQPSASQNISNYNMPGNPPRRNRGRSKERPSRWRENNRRQFSYRDLEPQENRSSDENSEPEEDSNECGSCCVIS